MGERSNQRILDAHIHWWDLENNYYPRRLTPSRVEAFKFKNPFTFDRRDIMQDIKTELLTEDSENKAAAQE